VARQWNTRAKTAGRSPFLLFINALSAAVASTPHAPPAIALSTCRHDANPRLSQPANHLAKFDQFLIGHEAQTFAQLLQFGLRWIQKQWTSPVSPAEVGPWLYLTARLPESDSVEQFVEQNVADHANEPTSLPTIADVSD